MGWPCGVLTVLTHKVPLTPAMDASELLGCFEQARRTSPPITRRGSVSWAVKHVYPTNVMQSWRKNSPKKPMVKLSKPMEVKTLLDLSAVDHLACQAIESRSMREVFWGIGHVMLEHWPMVSEQFVRRKLELSGS